MAERAQGAERLRIQDWAGCIGCQEHRIHIRDISAHKDWQQDVCGLNPDVCWLNYSEDKDANGCSCFYFKGLKSYSLSGYRIANIVQDKIIGNLKVLDCRVHGANYAVLKATTMTSVLVEPGFISNYTEREKIKKTGYQMKISESIVEAILEYLSE